MAEFKDLETDEIITVAVYYSVNGKYLDKFKNELVNKNGKPLELIEKEKDWSDPDEFPAYAAFNSKSTADKKTILKKRSKSMEFQTNREGRDKKDWIDGKDLQKKKKK